MQNKRNYFVDHLLGTNITKSKLTIRLYKKSKQATNDKCIDKSNLHTKTINAMNISMNCNNNHT